MFFHDVFYSMMEFEVQLNFFQLNMEGIIMQDLLRLSCKVGHCNSWSIGVALLYLS